MPAPSAADPDPPLAAAPPGGGLDEAEARARLAAEGPNELPRAAHLGALRYLLEILREPLVLLLVVAGLLYLFLGSPKDSVLLLGSVVVIIAIEYYQGRQSEHALEALRAMGQPGVVVLRGGLRRTVPAAEVVRGDLVLLTEGERVPADGRLVSSNDVTVDESLLTGESAPVRKRPARPDDRPGRPGGEDRPFVYAQTLIVRGQGLAEVTGTGPRTEVARIAQALTGVERETPVLQKQTRAVVLTITVLAIALSILVAGLIGARSGAWLTGLLAGIALAITMLPEEIPIILTVYTALGARRMARQRALTRRLAAIPTLGAVTVLCTDKTGTLTENRMVVERLVLRPAVEVDARGSPPPEARALVLGAALASSEDPFDPMEKAIQALRARAPGLGAPSSAALPLRRYPLRPELLAVTQVWKRDDGGATVAAKGAPEDILELCRPEAGVRERWEAEVEALGGRGYRVLGVASGEWPPGSVLPSDPRAFRLDFLGLIGLADPVRPEVPAAIAECHAAGIRVVMVTGDHPETAQAIAKSAGIAHPERVLTGEELLRMPLRELEAAVAAVNVYARFAPEEKLRLVEALKQNGEIVGMTGDGVNDAPALRAAHIGIAMGQRGTDVAREAAAIVLLDDAFPTIVHAVRVGRRIYANMRKAIGYLLAIHTAIGGMALLPVLLGLPLLLFPVQIVFLEFIIDPTSAISFEAEPEERDVMASPPREPEAPLFSTAAIGFRVLQGAGALAAALAVYLLALQGGGEVSAARAMAFAALVGGNILLVIVCRSESIPLPGSLRIRNRVLLGVVLLAAGLLGSAIYLPPIAQLFDFVPLGASQLLVAIGAAALGTLWVEPVKLRLLARLHRADHVASGPGVRPTAPR